MDLFMPPCIENAGVGDVKTDLSQSEGLLREVVSNCPPFLATRSVHWQVGEWQASLRPSLRLADFRFGDIWDR
jgi:hypothetical protein